MLKPDNWRWGNDKSVITEEIALKRAVGSFENKNDFSIENASINEGAIVCQYKYRYRNSDKPRNFITSKHLGEKYSSNRDWYDGESIEDFRQRVGDKDEYIPYDDETLEKMRHLHFEKVKEWEREVVKLDEKRESDKILLLEQIKEELRASENHVICYQEFCNDIIPRLDLTQFLHIAHEEPIVQAYNKFIVGYWDIVVRVHRDLQVVCSNGSRYNTYYDGNIRWTSNYGEQCIEELIPKFYIEVKPTIESYGAVIRQLKTYQNYLPKGEFNEVCLLTPDTRFDEAFKQQGIQVISPPECKSPPISIIENVGSKQSTITIEELSKSGW
jgi:hypothetical protein